MKPDMAAYASRTIRFRDGHVESDERYRGRRKDALMLWNALNLAQREIRRNVLRSSLTTLGIIIGVVRRHHHGDARERRHGVVTADIANLGSNLLTVMPGQRVGPAGRPARRSRFISATSISSARDVTSVSAVAPVSSQGMSAVGRQQESIDDGDRNDQRLLRIRATGSSQRAACLRSRAAIRRGGLRHR